MAGKERQRTRRGVLKDEELRGKKTRICGICEY